MDEVWNGILTCDYEHTRPEAGPLEHDLYTASLIAWPSALLGCATPYGRRRRRGIVDIPEARHRHLTGELHQRLRQTTTAQAIITAAETHRTAAGHALTVLTRHLSPPSPRTPDRCPDRAALTAALTRATTAMLTVMSTHIVNWLLPEQRWEHLLTQLLGDRSTALACLSAFQTPTGHSHILTTPNAISGTTAHPQPNTADHTAGRTAGHAAARANRETWRCSALLAAAGDTAIVDEVRAAADVLQWAAESEERRRELRDAYLAAATHWCSRTGTDPARLTLDDILTTREPSR